MRGAFLNCYLPMLASAVLLASCQASQAPATGANGSTGATKAVAAEAVQAGAAPGDTSDAQPYDGITAAETVHFTGTEPFWGGQVAGATLTYLTPENQDGTAIPVQRFAGRGGVSWSGTLQDQPFRLAVTEGVCSDGMSDRSYPFTATLQVLGEQRQGCAWTDRRGATMPEGAGPP